jgi:hypothetical protein
MRRWLAAAALAWLLLPLLSGCGSSQDANRNSNRDRPIAAPPATTQH